VREKASVRECERAAWRVALLGLAVITAGCGNVTRGHPTTRPLPSRTATRAPAGTRTAVETHPPTLTPTVVITPTPAATAEPSSSPTSTYTPSATIAPTETPVPTATPTAEIVATPIVELASIGTITSNLVGEELTVKGTVVGAASFSQGFEFTLDDGTGRIVLLMWHDVYDDCWDSPQINLGTVVRASGEVSVYEGQLQIEPHFGGEVKAIAGPSAQPPRRDIGSISGDDAGQRVTIEGEVLRTEGLSSAVKVFIKDETGEVLVFVWRNVLDRIDRNTALGTPGSRVRVVGTAQVYRSNLEVVPALPNDVVVLQVPG
jgi:DNA/RNA endonuclease YhcR with UshA esterase domain